jgi:putative transposase
VLSAIRSGVAQRDENDIFHGVPGVFVWDNGLEFTANAVTEAAALLGSVAVTTPPYSPAKKPYIERVNRTIETELISSLPHYTEGPRRRDGKLEDSDDSMLSLEGLSHLVANWIEHYNYKRPHGSLDEKSPAQHWLDDPTPIRSVDPEAVRQFTLERRKAKIRRDAGIQYKNVSYVAPEMYGLETETVEIGVIPYDLSRIEVFRGGEWYCTATPAVELSADQVTKHREAARKADELLKRERRRLRREQRDRFAEIGPHEMEPRILPPDPKLPRDESQPPDVFKFGDQIGEVE